MEGIHHSFKADLCMECFAPSWLIKHHMQWRVFPTETSEDPKWKLFWVAPGDSEKNKQINENQRKVCNQNFQCCQFQMHGHVRSTSFSGSPRETKVPVILIPPTRGIKYENIVVRYKKFKNFQRKTHRSKQKHGLYTYIKHLLKSFPKPSYVANVKTSGSLSWGDSDGTFFGLAFAVMKALPYPHHPPSTN